LHAGHRPPPAPRGFAVRADHDNGHTVVRFIGDLDLATVAQARRALDAATASAPDLTVDLGDLAFIDSTGMKLLLELRARCRSESRGLTILPGPPGVRRAFEVAKIDQLLPLERADGDGSSRPPDG
jgi:anti-anti-sigma factor